MSLILLRLAPYLLAAAAVFSGGWYAGGLAPKAALGRLQAADDHTRALQAEAALKAVQGQLEQAQTVSTNNAQTVEKLNAQNALIAADRDGTLARVRRLEQLLQLAAHPAATGDHVSPPADQPGTAGAGEARSLGPLESLLGDAAAEFEFNRAHLDGLLTEVKPQL